MASKTATNLVRAVQVMQGLVREIESFVEDTSCWEHDLQQLGTACRDVVEHLNRVRPSQPRVVCIGRTKAGKSTLRYALTGAGADGIGLGGQRTTRDTVSYEWAGLELVDTPGVGALGGGEDAALAVDAARTADLVVWVASSDSQQPATVRTILEAIAPGLPVVVLLNHKQSFTDDELAAGPSDEAILTDPAGHEARVRHLLQRAGRGNPTVAHVNLWLAGEARKRDDDALLARSGLPAAETMLSASAAEAFKARAATAGAVLRHRVALVVAAARTAAATIRRDKERLSRERGRLLAARDTAHAAYEDKIHRRVGTAFAAAELRLESALNYAVAEEHRGKAEQHLRAEVEAALGEARRSLQREADVALEAALRQLPPELRPGGTPPPLQLSVGPLPALDLEGDPLNSRAAKTTARGLELGLALLLTFATEGLAAPLVLGALGTGAVEGSRRALAPDLHEETARRRASVDRAELACGEVVRDTRRTTRQQALKHWSITTGQQSRPLPEQADRIEHLSSWAARLARNAAELEDQEVAEGIPA